MNPLALLVAATVPALALLVSVDPVTPSVVLLATGVAVRLSPASTADLLRRARPLLLAAVSIGVLNALLSPAAGRLLVDVGPVDVTTGAAVAGASTALRLLAVALPGLLAVLLIDPVDLADALVQQARLPARPAYGALVALRLVPLLTEDWTQLRRARRARGIAAGSPVAAGRLFASQVLGLLVQALRRGTRIATAMDARGFDSTGPRTHARRAVLTAADRWLVVLSVLVTVGAVGLSVTTGAWRPVLG